MPEITKKDQLDWLDMQRDAVNTEIVYAAPNEQKQYHKNLQIINHLAELVRRDDGEMTAVEYLEAHQEMCLEHLDIDNFPPSACTGCPLDDPHCNCEYFALHYPRRAVEIVKRWKEERDGKSV